MIYQEDRPWGGFEILYEEAQLKVKRIRVKPNKRLSLQSHRHRAETWVITEGNAIVTLDQKEIFLSPNQTVYIPKGAKHRIENREDTDIVFIEVQTGTYLGEDDIIRYQDDFNRV